MTYLSIYLDYLYTTTVDQWRVAVMVSRRIRMNMDEQIHISLVGLRRAPKHTHVKCYDYPMIVNLVWFLTIKKKVVLGWFPYWPSVSSDVVVMLLQFSQISLDFGGSPSFGCPPSRLRDFTRSEQGMLSRESSAIMKISFSQSKSETWLLSNVAISPFLTYRPGHSLLPLCRAAPGSPASPKDEGHVIPRWYPWTVNPQSCSLCIQPYTYICIHTYMMIYVCAVSIYIYIECK